MTDWTPSSTDELCEFVANAQPQNEESPARLVPAGGRTSLGLVEETQSTTLIATTSLNQVRDYPHRDMTITVEAGIRVEDLTRTIAEHRQQLAIDVPQANRATLGGAIATNCYGPGRFGQGTFRDAVIGISAVDGRGRLFSAGGRVVKNVAGYDLCKLLIGSRGTLATITEVTLKLQPMHERRAVIGFAFDQSTPIEPALKALNVSRTRPIAIDLLNPKAAWQISRAAATAIPDRQSLLVVAFAGTDNEVTWQLTQVAEELRATATSVVDTWSATEQDKLYNGLVDFQVAADDPVTFQATLPKANSAEFLQLCNEDQIAVQIHAGSGVAWGQLSDEIIDVAAVQNILDKLRRFVESREGALAVTQCDDELRPHINLFSRPPDAWPLMTAIKQQLDPHGLLIGHPWKFSNGT